MDAIGSTLLIDKTIQKYEYLFRWIGINISTVKNTRADVIKRRLTYIFNFIWMNTDVGGAFVWVLVGIAQSKSFTELTYIAPCVTLSILGNTKALYLIIYSDKVKILINKLRELEIKEKGKMRDDSKDEIMKADYNFLMRLIKILNVLYLLLVTAFALNPLCLIGLEYYSSGEIKLALPFLIVYPFDPFNMSYYPWVYLHQIWSEIAIVMCICASDYLFYTFCTYIRTQFLLLKYYIEILIPPGVTAENLNKEEIRLQFIELIKMHQDLISCADLLEELYTKAILQNFFSSSILICLTGFNVTVITDYAIRMTFISFLFMSLFQIFFLCLFGDLMMASSMEVREAVYNTRWYIADPSFGKYILLVQTRALKPCTLTAYSFYDVNLKAYMKILSTSWSYFALLQTLYGSSTD